LGIPTNLKSIQQQAFYKHLIRKCNKSFSIKICYLFEKYR